MKMIITDIKEKDDGSASAIFNYDKEAGKFIREKYDVKRISKKVLQKLIDEAVDYYLKKDKK